MNWNSYTTGLHKVSFYDPNANGIKTAKSRQSFFLNLEKIKAKRSTIKIFKNIDGSEETDNKLILENIKRFYVELFSKTCTKTSISCGRFVNNINTPKLSHADKAMCDSVLTIDKLLSMENYKSPGTDGLTKEFYEAFWDDISQPLFYSLLKAKDKKNILHNVKQLLSFLKRKEEI